MISTMHAVVSVLGAVASWWVEKLAPYLLTANAVLGSAVTVWQIVTNAGWMRSVHRVPSRC